MSTTRILMAGLTAGVLVLGTPVASAAPPGGGDPGCTPGGRCASPTAPGNSGASNGINQGNKKGWDKPNNPRSGCIDSSGGGCSGGPPV